MSNILKKENRIVLIVGIFCLIFIGAIINYTYSFFAVEQTNSSIIAGEAESMKLDLTVVEKSSTNNGKLIPQLDEYITSAVIGRNGSCIDDNNNTVCQVYKITLKNSGSSSVYVNGEVVIDNKDNPNLKWAILNNTDTDVLTAPVLNGAIKTPEETVLTSNELFTAGQTKNYFIVVWISETGLMQIDSGKFTGVVNFNNNEGGIQVTSATTLLSLGLEVDSDNSPDFSKTSCSSGCDEATVGIYEAEDDLGTSYYFRGDVTNNYVKFGKNASNQDMYWRIIRINGDGTVRMIYMDTDINATGLMPVDESVFNTNYDDNTYVGYMYGDEGQSTYALTHSNKYDSQIKTFLEGIGNNDGWYYNNIVATGYHDYVADAIYCNDRSLSSGTGIGTITTRYGAYGRLNGDTVLPTLKCDFVDYTNDSFTQTEELGNGLLRYPIGLITVDEVALAGGVSSNTKHYLYSSYRYFTMSAYTFSNEFWMYSTYNGSVMVANYASSEGILPVISLKSTSIIDGSGIKTDPFVVE